MAILSTFWADLEDMVSDIWTDATAIGRATIISKIDFGRQTAPWAILKQGAMPQSADMGIKHQTFQPRVSVYYIRKDGAGAAAAIEAKLEALASEALTRTFSTGVQILDVGGYDVSEDLDANQALFEQNKNLIAGKVDLLFLIGETVS